MIFTKRASIDPVNAPLVAVLQPLLYKPDKETTIVGNSISNIESYCDEVDEMGWLLSNFETPCRNQ